ncbi:MAG TPA: tetratricopeptide repeat protein [Pontibacter sp.]
MLNLVLHSVSFKRSAAAALLTALLATGSSCDVNQGAGEQMVDLSSVSDDPAAQLGNLNDAIARNRQDGNLYSRRAALLLQNGDFQQALSDVNEAIRLEKNDMANLFLKAQILRATGKLQEALLLALRAERNSYESAALYVLLSDLYVQLGQPKQAATYVKKALELSPDNAYALYYRGRVAAAQGDTARALTNYKLALQQAPDFKEARRDLAGALVNRGLHEEARVQLERAMKQTPKDGLLWFFRGQLYQAVHKPDSALWSYNKALTFADSLSGAHFQSGLLLYARGDYAGTIQHLEKAARDYSSNTKLVATLASAYERTGQNINALEQYQRLVTLQPGYTAANYSIARLKAKLTRPVPRMTDTLRTTETDNITSQ